MIAGHELGRPVAWLAAQLRPDRFPAVIALSVPGAVMTSIRGFQAGLTSVNSVVDPIFNGQILAGGSASACAKCVTNTALIRYSDHTAVAFGAG